MADLVVMGQQTCLDRVTRTRQKFIRKHPPVVKDPHIAISGATDSNVEIEEPVQA